jgi:hypothetical protein
MIRFEISHCDFFPNGVGKWVIRDVISKVSLCYESVVIFCFSSCSTFSLLPA